MLAEDQNVPSAGSEDAVSNPLDPIKSYDNKEWMHSRGARQVRILCEYLEVRDRLRAKGILSTFVVFGSARAVDRQTWENKMAAAKLEAASPDAARAAAAAAALNKLRRIEWCCEWYEKTRQLAKLIMAWVQTEEAKNAIGEVMREIPLVISGDDPLHVKNPLEGLKEGKLCAAALCTGGGPGLMEAANRGAREVEGALSVGMGMTLPFETGLNRYINKDLGFMFHYFFTRKFWMTYAAIAVICAPGGVGTLDELMEIINLKQCRKLKRDIPIILLGKQYWQKAINFEYMEEMGMMDGVEVSGLFFADEPEEAFNYLREYFVTGKLLLRNHVHKSMRPRV